MFSGLKSSNFTILNQNRHLNCFGKIKILNFLSEVRTHDLQIRTERSNSLCYPARWLWVKPIYIIMILLFVSINSTSQHRSGPYYLKFIDMILLDMNYYQVKKNYFDLFYIFKLWKNNFLYLCRELFFLKKINIV